MTERTELISQVYIKLDGQDAPTRMMDNLISVEVDDSLNLPDMFTINIRDQRLEYTDSDSLSIGTAVEIAVPGDNQRVTLISGEITSVETSFRHGAGATVLVRGYDQSHRLNRGNQTRSFNQVTDSDIATRIARDLGLRTQIDSTDEVYDYVLQNNQSNLEFLMERARHIGFRAYVEGDTLYFRQAPDDNGQPPVLEFGVNLLEFNARLTTSGQTNGVEVRGWDPSTKQEIVGRASSAQDRPEVGESREGGALAENAFGNAGTRIIVNRVVNTQAEADALAQSACDEMGGDFIQAEGACSGNPAVIAGAIVQFRGLSDRFTGRYRISHALHRYDARGYTTRFTISGRHSNTLTELVGGGSSSSVANQGQGGGGSHSVVVGIVTNNQDSDGMARVKVRFPWLSQDAESNWIRVASPMAGNGRGMVFLPEVDDEVLIAFENGDLNRPYVLGALWNGEDSPPETNSDGHNNIRKIRSRSGHEIVFNDDDTSHREKIEIHTNAGHIITMDDSTGSEKIEIKDKTGNNSIKLDSVQNAVAISGATKITLDAPTVELTSQGNMTFRANGILTIQGSMVRIN
jgi:phage protein D/phage baseplate assembly protein gpV